MRDEPVGPLWAFACRLFSREGRRVVGLLLVVAAIAAVGAGCSQRTPKASIPTDLHSNVTFGQSASGSPLKEDIYSPRDRRGSAPMIIVVHGGGFTGGDKQGVSQFGNALAALGYVVADINYTLATPQHAGYPEQVNDVRRAIQWNIANGRRFGADPSRIGLLGFSAGGYLAAMAGLQDSNLPGHPIRSVITLSAPLDLLSIDQVLRARVAACGYRRFCPQLPHTPPLSAFATMFEFLGCPTGNCSKKLIREASPSSHITATAPPFLIFNAADELVPKSQATDMGHLLRQAGVPAQVVIVPGNGHATAYLAPESPTILKFLDRQLRAAPLRRVPDGRTASSSGQTILVASCAIVAVASVVVVAIGMRRRRRVALQ
jgi:acetyl esterase/lipase